MAADKNSSKAIDLGEIPEEQFYQIKKESLVNSKHICASCGKECDKKKGARFDAKKNHYYCNVSCATQKYAPTAKS